MKRVSRLSAACYYLHDDPMAAAPAGCLSPAMKIAIVSSLRPYNEARLYDRQAVHWADRGNDVHIIARNLGEKVEDVPPRIDVTRLESNLHGWARRLHLGWQAKRQIEAIRPDVVHYHDPELHFWLPRLHAKGINVVYDVRENFPFLVVHRNRFKVRPVSAFFSALFWKLETRVLRRAFLVSVTHGLTDIYKTLNRPIITIMNFPSTRRFVLREPARDPVMICGGTLNADRGLFELVELLARVKRRVPGARLLLCGSFASVRLKSAVLARAQQLDVSSSVDVLDRVSHHEYVRSVLPRARLGVYISPPNAQTDLAFPVRLGEYWATGLPTVANDLPELKRIWDADPFFDVFRYDNMDALQEIAEKYLVDYDAAVASGRLARRRVEQAYNGEFEFEKLYRFYRDEVPTGVSATVASRVPRTIT
jgi:glycosyltransferase involved in cell wall biosynthesis